MTNYNNHQLIMTKAMWPYRFALTVTFERIVDLDLDIKQNTGNPFKLKLEQISFP